MSLLLVGCFFEQHPGGVCGDGELAIDEQCDDGNTTDGDSCSSRCRYPPSQCGNGVVNEGEECDRAIPSPLCDNDCTLKVPYVYIEWWFRRYFDTIDRCLPGSAPVNVHVQELDENGATVGAEIVQAANCDLGRKEVMLPGFGIYKVWVDGTTGTETYVGLAETIDMRSIAFTTVYIDVYLDAGYPRIVWSITDMQDAPLDCAQAGAADVELLVYGPVDAHAADQIGPCAPGSLLSLPLPLGTHSIRVNLVGTTNAFLSTIGPFDVTVSEPNAVSDVNVTFKVAP